MLTMDEPGHTRLRTIVDEAFRRRAVLDMEPRVRAIADASPPDCSGTEALPTSSQRYARMLPLSVICELLGLPPADRPKFIAWANTVGRLTNVFGFLRMIRGFMQMKRYLERHLQRAREQGGEGLIAELVESKRKEGVSARTKWCRWCFCCWGRVGDYDPPDQWLGLRAAERSQSARLAHGGLDRAGLAVEEFLRFVSPVQFSKPRFVREDVNIGGVRLKKGDRIMAMIAAANVDPKERASRRA